jgi:hypothetical protein
LTIHSSSSGPQSISKKESPSRLDGRYDDRGVKEPHRGEASSSLGEAVRKIGDDDSREGVDRREIEGETEAVAFIEMGMSFFFI